MTQEYNPAIDLCECALCPQKGALFVLARICGIAVSRVTVENAIIDLVVY